MVTYSCTKCSKEFNQKCHLITHLNKKRPCTDDTYKQYIIKDKDIDVLNVKVSPNAPKTIKKCTKNTNITEINKEVYNNNDIYIKEQNELNINENNIKYVCNICNMSFTRASSLKRHNDGRCKKALKLEKDKDEKEELKKMILMLQEQVTKLNQTVANLDKTNVSNLTNNSGTIDNKINNQVNNQLNGNVTTNNIKIEFGKEDLSKISNDFFIKTLLNSSGALIPSKIIQRIHFNSEFQEFINVFISDFSRNKAMIYDGKTWNIAKTDEIVNTLFDKAIIFCEDYNEELYDKIKKK